MLKDFHYNDNFSWPGEHRTAVTLTFDFQGGEDVRPLADGKIDHEQYTQHEYGPQTAIWRILRILEEEAVRATFMICGGIAERYPETAKAIIEYGHEIAGHGYHHEIARNLTKEQEIAVMKKTSAVIESTSGRTPIGWRTCTQSPNTVEILMDHGYLWNSNTFGYDMPFLWESNGRLLVELPRQPFGDGRTYQIYGSNGDGGNPNDTLVIWKAMFDELHKESKRAPRYVPFQFHPFVSGRPGRGEALRTIIQHMKNAEGTWLATGSEVARWCLDEVFTAERKNFVPRKIAQGVL